MSTVSSTASPDEGPTPDDHSPAERLLVDAVRKSHCILFLGAGVHFPPPEGSPFTYPEEERPPLGGALAVQLAADCNFANVVPEEMPTLQRVSLCYEKELGRTELVATIRKAVEEDTRPSAAVRALAELPFPLVITTNYDTLFEKALGGAGKYPLVAWYDAKGESPTTEYTPGKDPSFDAPFVFKVHGDVNHAESIVVTDEDYIGFVLRMSASDRFHPIPETFRYRFQKWPTLFVGYSLFDYNLRLLFRTLRWRIDKAELPDNYSIDKRPDPLISDRWQKEQGFRFIAEDVWDWVPWLYGEVLGREMPP
jgi:SIR2-like domain